MTTKPAGLMDQYLEMKKQAGEAVLFFRVGDFYEMFYEDAETCSKALGIALTSRQKDEIGGRIPMAGVPVKAAEGYLARMIRQGFKIAICEQVEEASQAKGVVRREIVRVVTPGTLTEDGVLSALDHNYLLAVHRTPEAVGLAWVDLSTGTFLAEDFPEGEVLHHLVRLDPGEVLVGEDALAADDGFLGRIGRETRAAITRRADWNFRAERARERLVAHFRVQSLAGFGCDELGPALGAAGATLAYLEETQKSDVGHVRRIARFPRRERMVLDRATLGALEVARTMKDGDRKGTLLWAVDRTVTAMGARLLKDWLLSPLLDPAEIGRRQDAVAEFLEKPAEREALRGLLARVQDLERIAARISCLRAGPRELLGLRSSTLPFPEVRRRVLELFSPGGLLAATGARVDPLEDLSDLLARALADEVPPSLADGGVFRRGWNVELDECRSMVADGNAWLVEYQAREVARSGIASLKVGYNSV